LALLKRQGNTLIDAPKLWRNMDGQQVAARIIRDLRERQQRYEAEAGLR
jgi:hypothetical protein